jgi:ribosomal subunit interface protein
MTTLHVPAEIVVHGRHFEVSQRFRDHVATKLARVDRFGITLTRIDVEVTKEANPRQSERAFEVELTCVGRGPVIRAEAAADDKYAALDVAYARLEERLRRAAERRQSKHRRHATHSNGLSGELLPPALVPTARPEPAEPVEATFSEPDVVYEDGPIVVRDKTHPSAPMTVSEALHSLELVGHDFFLFLDSETNSPTVVYKRRGYDYGLLRLQVADAGQAEAAS